MKTFILLTKLSPDLSKQMSNRAQIGGAWLDTVKEKCPDVKFLGHYALLGEYDFLDIYEAPDDDTAAMVSMISRQYGAFEAKSLIAIPYSKFLNLVEKLG